MNILSKNCERSRMWGNRRNNSVRRITSFLVSLSGLTEFRSPESTTNNCNIHYIILNSKPTKTNLRTHSLDFSEALKQHDQSKIQARIALPSKLPNSQLWRELSTAPWPSHDEWQLLTEKSEETEIIQWSQTNLHRKKNRVTPSHCSSLPQARLEPSPKSSPLSPRLVCWAGKRHLLLRHSRS